MPTIKQLPAATAVGGSDLLPVSQSGLTRGVSVSTLLSNTQPLLSLLQGALLGRASTGAGLPEVIGVGTGLALQSGTVIATAADHVSLTLSTSLLAGDEVVLNSGAAPKRLAATQLRSLFSAGSGIQIDGSGVISSMGISGSGGGGGVGSAGPAGPTGAAGSTGPQGATGPQGVTGPQGATGQGFQFRGSWQGNVAYNPYDVITNGGQTYVAAGAIPASATFSAASWSLVASQGSSGAPGMAGPPGAAGSTGSIGPAGAAGSAGATGSMGAPGAAGATGPIGSTGAPGTPGSVGPVGPAGATGAAGPTGAIGATGPAGSTVAATSNAIGAVKPGVGLAVATDGTLTVTTVSLGALAQSSAATGQLLGWSGTTWTPTTPASGVTFTGVAPITVASGTISIGQSGATTGQVLTWNGSAWVPQQAASGTSVGTATPLAPGVASAGTSTNASREDHRHPSDITRAPLAGPAFTGSITLPGWTTTTRPASPIVGMEGFATDLGRQETYTAAGWVQYVRLADLPAAGGQLLGGTSVGGAAAAVSIGSGLSLSGGMLSLTSGASSATSGVSINGNSILASTSSPYQMAPADRVVDVSKTNGSATKILLPTNPTLWVDYTIIDGKGDAVTNNITISVASGTSINGQSSFVMNANNDAITLRAVSATMWRVA